MLVFGLGVIRALVIFAASLEVGRFAFTAGEFVTALLNEAGLYVQQLQDKREKQKKEAAAR